MGAAQLPIEIEQGSNFRLVVTLVGGPDSWTGYTGRMQIRAQKSSSEVLFDTSEITVDTINKQAVLEISAVDTAEFDWTNGSYDVLLTSGDEQDAYRVVEGKVKVDHSVTRED